MPLAANDETDVASTISADILAQKLAATSGSTADNAFADDVPHAFERVAVGSAADVQALEPKASTFMFGKHLLPRFGDKPLSEIARQEIQVAAQRLGHRDRRNDRSRRLHLVAGELGWLLYRLGP